MTQGIKSESLPEHLFGGQIVLTRPPTALVDLIPLRAEEHRQVHSVIPADPERRFGSMRDLAITSAASTVSRMVREWNWLDFDLVIGSFLFQNWDDCKSTNDSPGTHDRKLVKGAVPAYGSRLLDNTPRRGKKQKTGPEPPEE